MGLIQPIMPAAISVMIVWGILIDGLDAVAAESGLILSVQVWVA